MPSSNFVPWYLKKGSNKYLTWQSENKIVYRANNYNIANLVFEISNKSDPIRGQLSGEDAVQVYIGDPDAGGVKMMDGFTVNPYPIRRKDAQILLYVDVIDYVSYLAGKTVFELRYWLLANTTAKQVFTDAAGTISGVTTNIDSNLTNLVKQDFTGTYAKDGFSAASQSGFADFFGDENKVLQAFSHGGRDLKASNNVRYKLVDAPPAAVNQIRINSNYDYFFKHDATQRFKQVIATSGVAYTFPNDIDQMQKEHSHYTLYGKEFSLWYSTLNGFDWASWDPNQLIADGLSPSLQPFDFSGVLNVGAVPYPVVKLNTRKSTDTTVIAIGKISSDFSAINNLGLPLDGTWQEISFFIRTDELSPTPTGISIFLLDQSINPGAQANRFLKNGATTLLISGGMTFIRFLLPTPTSNNGWTQSNPKPAAIDSIQIQFTPSTGYTGNVKISQLYLYRKVRKTSSTVAGSPATTKIITDRTLLDETALQALADSEFSRVSPMPYEVKATFYGNSDFRKPGYAIDADFTRNLEPGSVGTQLRIDEIIHELDKSRWNTTVTLKPAYQRL